MTEPGPAIETKQVSSPPGVPGPPGVTSSVIVVVMLARAGSAVTASKPPPVMAPTETVKLSEPSARASSIVRMSKVADDCPAEITTSVTAVKSLPSVAVPA